MKESKETTKSEKVCPLFAIREKRTEERYYRRCIKDECAWWAEVIIPDIPELAVTKGDGTPGYCKTKLKYDCVIKILAEK